MKKTLLITAALTVICTVLILLKLELAKPAENLIRLYGNVDIRQVDISFQVGGKVRNMLFEEGERVKKGDVLAELDDRDYRENYLQTLAEIKRAAAARDEAQDVLNTNQPLCGQGFTSQRLCRSYTNALAEAEGTLESAEVAKRYAEISLPTQKFMHQMTEPSPRAHRSWGQPSRPDRLFTRWRKANLFGCAPIFRKRISVILPTAAKPAL